MKITHLAVVVPLTILTACKTAPGPNSTWEITPDATYQGRPHLPPADVPKAGGYKISAVSADGKERLICVREGETIGGMKISPKETLSVVKSGGAFLFDQTLSEQQIYAGVSAANGKLRVGSRAEGPMPAPFAQRVFGASRQLVQQCSALFSGHAPRGSSSGTGAPAKPGDLATVVEMLVKRVNAATIPDPDSRKKAWDMVRQDVEQFLRKKSPEGVIKPPSRGTVRDRSTVAEHRT